MKDFDRLGLQKETILKEWEILWDRVVSDEDRINTIRNWCIVTLTALGGFLIRYHKDIIRNENEGYQIVLLLPLFVIFFFCLNESFRQIWKWQIFGRLYRMEKLMQEKFSYKPSFLPRDVRKKLEGLEKRNNETKNSFEPFSLKNPLFTLNFPFFYGLLFYFCSVSFL